jgi:iron complex outermembrane receptor protein
MAAIRLILSFCVMLCFFAETAKSQTTISGTVTDDAGKPLIGANIVLANTGLGATSDDEGRFEISCWQTGTAMVQVSYIGFETLTKKIRLNGETIMLNLSMNPAIINAGAVEIKAEAERRPLNQPYRVERILQTEIRQLPAQSTDQLFVTSPGVNVNRDFGIYSDKAVVTLRGQSGSDQSRTLVMVDGVPVNKSDGGSVNWNFIRPENIRQVEITKGPASAEYGSSAMGGAINIITTKPMHAFNVEAQVEAGQWNTYGGMVKISGKKGDTLDFPAWYQVSAMARSSDGYISQPEETIMLYDSVVVPDFLEEQAIQVKSGITLQQNNHLTLEMNYYNDKRGQGIKIYEEDGSWSSHQTWFAKTGYNGRAGSVDIHARAYFLLENYYRVNEYFSDGEYVLYDVDSRRSDMGAIASFSKPAGKNQTITAGFELKHGRVDASDIYYTATDKIDNRGQMNLGALYAMDEIKLMSNKLNINAGLRFDIAEFFNGRYSIQNPSYSMEYLVGFQDTLMQTHHWQALNPKLSVSYMPANGFRTYFSVAQGFRAPVLDDMCRSGRRSYGFKIANPNLGPEYITSIEWGFDHQSGNGWHAGISAFYSYGKDYMYAVSTGDSVNMGYTISPVYRMQNIGGVEIYGLEAEVSGKIMAGITGFVNYTRNFTEIVDFTPNTPADPVLTGKHLTSVPDHQANAGINWENRIVNVNLIAKYVGKRWINDRNIPDVTWLFEPQYPSTFNLDIKLQKNLGKHWLASLSIENIFDEVHYNNRGYKSPGRFVMGNITWRLAGVSQ